MSNNLVIKQLKKRIEKQKALNEAPKFLLQEHTFDKQHSFILDSSRYKTAVCSRRAGKSEACVADLINDCVTKNDIEVAYITLARTSAKRIIWRIIKRVLKKYQIRHKADNGDLTIEFLDTGSILYVSGAKDESEIEKFRGMSLYKVYIDECQSFRAYIRTLVDDIIIPALWDTNGTLCLIGTPGPVPAGFFFDCAHSTGWSNHKWTILDNPFIKLKSGRDPADILAEERKRKGIDESDPSYQREALGKWMKDDNSLVFHFNKDKNLYDKIPENANMVYIFGVDIGWSDADAIAVLGYNYTDNTAYLVEELITRKQAITPLIEQIKTLQEKYKPVKIVMDAGALGKKIQEEINARHPGFFIEAADKARKHEFIELMNDDLRTGKLKSREATVFEEDCSLVTWDREDPAKPKISDKYHTDIGDAVLYAWRECRHYISIPRDGIKPATNTVEFMELQEQKEMQAWEDKQNGDWGIDVSDKDFGVDRIIQYWNTEYGRWCAIIASGAAQFWQFFFSSEGHFLPTVSP